MNIKNNVTEKALQEIEKITNTKLTLGKLIWSIRRCAEISQSEFAKLLGISSSHLCDIEHDRKTVSAELAKKYAEILGYGEKQFVRLALQATLDKAGIDFDIELEPRRKKRMAKIHKSSTSASIR